MKIETPEIYRLKSLVFQQQQLFELNIHASLMCLLSLTFFYFTACSSAKSNVRNITHTQTHMCSTCVCVWTSFQQIFFTLSWLLQFRGLLLLLSSSLSYCRRCGRSKYFSLTLRLTSQQCSLKVDKRCVLYSDQSSELSKGIKWAK